MPHALRTTFTRSRSLLFTLVAAVAMSSACAGGEGTRSVAVTVPPPTAAPQAVWANPGDWEIVLMWTATSGADSYDVLWTDDPAAPVEAFKRITGVAGAPWKHTGLTAGRTYRYRVVAVNAGGASAPSAEVTADAGPAAPGAPQVLLVTPGDRQVELAWSATVGAGSFVVLWTDDPAAPPSAFSQITGITSAPWTHTGLTNGRTYRYRVVAVNAGGSSPPSGEVAATPVPPPPEAPTGVTAAAGDGEVALTWTAAADATSFVVLWTDDPAAEVDAFNRTSVARPPWTHAGLRNGRTFRYRVAAVNAGGASPPSAEVTATPVPSPPLAPAALSAEPGDRVVQLTWSAASRAESYTVLWTDDPAATLDAFNVTSGVTGSPWIHTGLTNRQTYRYRIVAVNAGGTSAPSAEAVAEPGPVPAAVEWVIAATSGSSYQVFWPPAQQADSYRVYYTTSALALEAKRPDAPWIGVRSSPAAIPGVLTRAMYFKVVGVNGTRVGAGSTVSSVVFTARSPVNASPLTASLWDMNGDGCLDVAWGAGNCHGDFTAKTLAELGLDGLVANGRINRDSRIGDLNGDGYPDLFTNVYARADDPGSKAMLHINDGTGHFTEDPTFKAMQLGGYGETVVFADFDNDGDLDIFVPNYWHLSDRGHNWLLINDGRGVFTERSFQAGVAVGPMGGDPWRPEGAQAIDFDEDGWIDIFVASQLFINNRDGTFTNAATRYGLPVRFDEGAQFVDLDLDGDFDYVLNDYTKLWVYRNEGGVFDAGTTFVRPGPQRVGCGLSVCDLNGDGFPDVVVPRNTTDTRVGGPEVWMNAHGTFVASDLGLPSVAYVDLIACADLDRNGSSDLLVRQGSGYQVLTAGADNPGRIRVRVLGTKGERNQQGRVVHIRPTAMPRLDEARVVDGGSAYMAQGDYDVLVPAPWPGAYEMSVRFADRISATQVGPGDDVTFYADGRVMLGLQ